MGAFGRLFNALTRRRTFDSHEYDSELARVLTLFDLVSLCVGSTLGLGVYVLAGSLAYNVAGPAVTLSFLIAGTASVFSALCYAELAATVPRAGSAYIYTYVMIGEFTAFAIGWNLVLEYMIGTAGVARGLSGYVDSLAANKMSQTLLENYPINVTILGSYPDIFSFCVITLLTILLSLNVKFSGIMSSIFTTINLSTISTVIVAGSLHAKPANWALPQEQIPKDFGTGGFFPYGISGVLAGAAKCFFGFVGFDCIASTGDEALNPKRNIPLALGIALTIILLTYFCLAIMLTLALPYYENDPQAPFIHIFEKVEWYVIMWMVTIGALFALSASLLGAMFPLPRVIYAMAHDKVLYFSLSKVNRYTKTPLVATILSGVLSGTTALVFDLDQLIDLMSIGTLMVYSIVAVCVIVLRYENDEMESVPLSCTTFLKQLCNCGHAEEPTTLSAGLAITSITIYAVICLIWCSFANIYELSHNFNVSLTSVQIAVLSCLGAILVLCIVVIARQPMAKADLFFQVPLVPYIPCLSIFVNFFLMFQLSAMTWLRYAIWLIVGFFIYFTYGIRHSNQFHRDTTNREGIERSKQT